MPEQARNRQSRQLAETALVRLVHAYGSVPEFVLLGGLVPDLLCSQSPVVHVGTTDVDMQVNLEIASGSVNAARLEAALHQAGFQAEGERSWRWLDRTAPGLIVKAEFLADLDQIPNQTTLTFDGCKDRTALDDLVANFVTVDAQGPVAYAETMLELHPERDWELLTNDAVTAINAFVTELDRK